MRYNLFNPPRRTGKYKVPPKAGQARGYKNIIQSVVTDC